jgi:hypothetical protein
VDLVITDISEKLIASFITAEKISEQGNKLAATSNLKSWIPTNKLLFTQGSPFNLFTL